MDFESVFPLVHESACFVVELDEGGQKVQTPGYKINKNWWCNFQYDDYSQQWHMYNLKKSSSPPKGKTFITIWDYRC